MGVAVFDQLHQLRLRAHLRFLIHRAGVVKWGFLKRIYKFLKNKRMGLKRSYIKA